MLSEFHFLRAEWLLALPVVLAVAAGLARRRLGAGNWQAVIAPQLLPYVLSRRTTGGGDARWWLFGLGGVLAVLALAGPAWERLDQPVYRSDEALVIALDLSRSMDAQDIAPSRLMRARLKILDILERRGSGQTALVVYSSNAFTVTPLTSDTDTIAALVASLGTDIMPSRGSYPIAAINKGRQLLEQAGAGYGEILLIADGGASPAAERVARDLVESGYSLSVLAVGTPEGAPIPRPNGGFVTGPAGEIAVPRLEERGLRGLARAGGGRFSMLTTDDSDLEHLLSGELGQDAAGDESMATDQWREEGPWLLLLLLPLAALAFRRGWVAVIVIAMLPATRPAEASLWDDLWLTRDQQAARALEDGDAAAASELFENPDWRAVADYRAGAYAESAAEFGDGEDARSLYNLGNALVRQGELESALDAYEQVLELDPDDEDARYNHDLVKQLLDQQQQQQQQDGQGQQSPNEQEEGEESESESQPSEEQQSSDSSSASEDEQGQEGDPSQREQEMSEEDMEALAEELRRAAEEANEQGEESEPQLTAAELEALRREQEEEQAMEQWLRRIPNDPGALLRNKFRYQYQKTGKDQDGNNTWPDDEVQPW